MAFLDNSGDIILDAVLTDLGRKRMAEGTFKITQFALGDDEIDYRIYNKNHPSGSAYYDLEILQTPVLEAFATTNASINHGLVSFNGNMNILYMPSLKVWGGTSKNADPEGWKIHRTSGSVYYVAANNDTGIALNAALTTDFGVDGANQYWQGPGHSTGILLETGIDSPSSNPPRSTNGDNRGYYLRDHGLLDSNFDVSFNHEFITKVGFLQNIIWEVNTDGTLNLVVNNPTQGEMGSDRASIPNYSTAIVNAYPTRIYQTVDGTTADANSAIRGPSGQMAMIHFRECIHDDLASTSGDSKYSLFGKTGIDLFGDGKTYDYIDTMIYITGRSSGVTAHVPLRITRVVQ